MFIPSHTIRLTGRKGVGISAIALTLITLLLPGCDYRGSRANVRDRNITAQEVVNETKDVIGRRVTVRSEPLQIVGTNAFTINNQQLFNDENILVINATGTPFTLPNDNIDIQVTGVVRKFRVTDVAREFNLDLQPDIYREYEDRPVIIAQSLALAPEQRQIANNPGRFYNQLVAVEAEVEEVLDPMAFTLDNEQLIGGRNLLVFNVNPQKPVSPDDKVVVTGIVRQFVVSEIERDYELTKNWNLQPRLEAEYRNRPVIIAQEVYPGVE